MDLPKLMKDLCSSLPFIEASHLLCSAQQPLFRRRQDPYRVAHCDGSEACIYLGASTIVGGISREGHHLIVWKQERMERRLYYVL